MGWDNKKVYLHTDYFEEVTLSYVWMGIVGFVVSFTTCALADELRFEQTESGIYQRLMEKSSGISKGLKFRGVSSSAQGKTIRVRGLTVTSAHAKSPTALDKDVLDPSSVSGGQVNLAIQFAVNSHAIQPQSIFILDNLGSAINRDNLKNEIVVINGHSDTDGTSEHNLHLSLKRAISVRDYLSQNFGISVARLRVMGYGEALPLVSNDTNEHKKLNRRVEISIVQ